MKTIEEKEKEIERLTKFWYDTSDILYQDYDSHWCIEKRWSYGEKPIWVAYHKYYECEDREAKCNSYEEALNTLLCFIKEVIQERKEWAKQVLQEPKDYDESQIRQAIKIIEFKL